MNFFTRTKFLIAVIVIQSAFLLAIIGTMSYHFFRFQREHQEMPRFEPRGEPRDEPKHDKQMSRYVAKRLQFTPEQIFQFDSLRETFHNESELLTVESRKIQKSIMDEIVSENTDIAKLKELVQKFGKLKEQQKQVMVNHLLEVKSRCTPHQQANFKKLVQQMAKHERIDRMRDNLEMERRHREMRK